jgi:hypothetical protein
MSELRVQGDDIKRLVKEARKGPVALGFNPGSGDEDAFLAMHKTKAPEVVGREAKTGADGGKFTFGPATVEGKVLTLTCLRDLPGAAKKLKKYLRSQKVMLNVVLLDADGNVTESDIEDLPPDEDDGDDPTGTGEIPTGIVAKRTFLIERWKKIPGELSEQVGQLGNAIATRLPHEDDARIRTAVGERLSAFTGSLQKDLDAAIITSINAGDATYGAVAAATRQFRARIASDPLVQYLKGMSLYDGSKVEAAYLRALDEVDAALTT